MLYALHNGKHVLPSTITTSLEEAEAKRDENNAIVWRLGEQREYNYRVVRAPMPDWRFF